MTISHKSPLLWFSLSALSVTVARVLFLPHAPGLFFDEAQYWTWAKAMDWGFYSKPPAVAAWIWLTTHACGDGEACIRLSSPLLHLATAYVIYLIGKTLYDNKTGALSGITYLTLPAVSVSSFLVSTDPSLMLCWALSLLFFIYAIRKDTLILWLACGIAAGCGLLSKYSMAFFAFSALLFLATHPSYRHHLRNPKLWSGAAVAALLFLPNVLWNINNHMVSFAHTEDNANLAGSLMHPDAFLSFFGAQFGVFGPILFAVLLWLLIQLPKLHRTENAGILLYFTAPFLGTILLLSFLSRAHANWAAPVYVPATILVVHWLLVHARIRWLVYASLGLHITVLVLFLFFQPLVHAAGFNLANKTSIAQKTLRDPFKRLRGWEQVGDAVKSVMLQYQKARLMTVSRKTHAYLRYYAQPYADTAVKWNASDKINDHYELTTHLSTDLNQPYILVSEWKDVSYITKHFKEVKPLAEIKIDVYPGYNITYRVYYLNHRK